MILRFDTKRFFASALHPKRIVGEFNQTLKFSFFFFFPWCGGFRNISEGSFFRLQLFSEASEDAKRPTRLRAV